MDLLPFSAAYATTVATWPLSATEVAMWCGRGDFPMPGETVAAWQQDTDVTAHLLVEDEQPLAYGELWFDAEEDEVELARIIVAPEARGRGLGRELVRGLLGEARGSGHSDVFMRVHPDNDRALRCYQGADFVRVGPELAEAWNAVQPVDYVWLRNQ